MSPRLKIRPLAILETSATQMEQAARDIAVAVVTALDVADGNILLVGPLIPVSREGVVIEGHIAFGRPTGRVVVLNVVPEALDLSSDPARAAFRDAIVAVLGRRYQVRTYASAPALAAAANLLQRDDADERQEVLH
jgi:hypothetical protein